MNNTTLKRVEELLTFIPNWRKVIIKRYIKFIDAYYEYGGNLEKVGRKFAFSQNDMLSIFGRIERHLCEIYELEQVIEVEEEVPVQPVNIEAESLVGVSENSKQVLKDVLEKSSTIENLQEILPEKLYEIVSLLLEYKNIEKVSQETGLGSSYIMQRITGRNRPRKPCERGALFYLGNEKGKVKTMKIKKQIKKSQVVKAS